MNDRATAMLEKERFEKVGGSGLERSAVIDSTSKLVVPASRARKDASVETIEAAKPDHLQAPSPSIGSGSVLPAVNRLADEQSDLRIAFARLLASGTTLPAAIETLGIEKTLAAGFLASDGFQELLRANLPKVEDVRDVLLAHASQAALKIVHLMNSAKSEEECGRSARDLLDRVGVVAKKHVSVASYHFHEAKSTLVEETLREIRGSTIPSNVGD